MTVEQKQLIQMQVSVLKQTMKKEGLVFGILVNKEDYDKSSICFMDRQALSRGERTGIVIGLEELNRGLIES